jgi:hypothetical protein
MITLRITLMAHLCGVGMGMATIVGLVPAVTKLVRAFIY